MQIISGDAVSWLLCNPQFGDSNWNQQGANANVLWRRWRGTNDVIPTISRLFLMMIKEMERRQYLNLDRVFALFYMVSWYFHFSNFLKISSSNSLKPFFLLHWIEMGLKMMIIFEHFGFSFIVFIYSSNFNENH